MRLMTLILALLIFAPNAFADDSEDPVAGMVAAFVKNINKLAQWPGEKVVTTKDRPLFVAVVGNTDLAMELKSLNSTKTADGHQLTVRGVDLDLLPANAHAVVICLKDTALAKSVVKRLAQTNTFIVATGPHKVGALLHCQVDPIDATKVICEASQAVADAEKIVIQKPLSMLARVIDK